MACKRDYKAEYARRKARGLARGLTLSQARGKPKPGEALISGKSKTPTNTPKINDAIKAMNNGRSMTVAAKDVGVSPERLAWVLAKNQLGAKQGRRWVIGDRRPRQIPMIKNARLKAVTVPSFAEASRAGQYHNDIRRFFRTQDTGFLEPYQGEGLTDVKGEFHPFETDPNTLIRYALKDEPVFHEIYRIFQPD